MAKEKIRTINCAGFHSKNFGTQFLYTHPAVTGKRYEINHSSSVIFTKTSHMTHYELR